MLFNAALGIVEISFQLVNSKTQSHVVYIYTTNAITHAVYQVELWTPQGHVLH